MPEWIIMFTNVLYYVCVKFCVIYICDVQINLLSASTKHITINSDKFECMVSTRLVFFFNCAKLVSCKTKHVASVAENVFSAIKIVKQKDT